MTEDTDYAGCIRGCVRRNRHVEDQDPHHACGHLLARQRDECTEPACHGCQPRRADHGQLCTPCHTRLRDWLGNGENSLRAALDHLNDAIVGRVQAVRYDRDGHQTDDGPPAPLDLARYDCRQLLLDRIFIYEERVRGELRQDLAGQYAFNPDTSLDFLARWLDRIESDLHPDLLGEMWDRFADVMIDAHMLVPWRREVRRCKGVECPECGRIALVFYGGEDFATCTWCRATFDRTTYDRWTALRAFESERMEA